MLSLTTHPLWRRWFGSRSERAAAAFLRKLGLRIIEHNFSCQLGEIDIIALDKNCIVFVEVRSTERTDTSKPALSVDASKQAKLTKLALFFLKARGLLEIAARFDVLAISWPAGAKEPTIVHYVNAFEPTQRFQMYS
jgi:putative endonuclease